jgi:succinyl-CoA synthetase beta subunit
MARRKIREYDAKRLSGKYLGLGIMAAQASPETNLDRLSAEHPWLKKERLVVKPDMLFGKRGKNKLILLDANYEQAKQFIKKNMNKDIEISGVCGVLTHFLIEPFLPHKDECYLSITSKRDGDHIAFSESGGMSVEENWAKMIHIDIPINTCADRPGLEEKLNGKLEGKRKANTVEFIQAAHRMYYIY